MFTLNKRGMIKIVAEATTKFKEGTERKNF